MANTKVKAEQLEAAQTNITSLGTLTSLTVDDITINGSTISDAGDFTLDIGGDIVLDADGGDVFIDDGGTRLLSISNAGSNNVQISTTISDGDLIFKGNDGGSTITALTFDMSEGGIATFAQKIHANKGVNFYTTDDQTNYWVQYTHTDDTLRFNYNGVSDDEIVVTTAGRVGIGTSSPTAHLEIEASSADAELDIDSNGGSGRRYRLASLTDGRFEIKDKTANSARITVTSSGNVGIGDTTPQALLDVGGGYGSNTTVATFAHATDAYVEIENITSQNGAGIILTNAGTKKWTIQKDTAAHSLHIQDASGDVMTFLQGGNVGIGTTAPASLLDLRTTTAGSLTSGSTRLGSVITLHHEAQWENGYTGGDFLGGIEWSSGDASTGEGTRAAIRTDVSTYYNTNSMRFYVAGSNSTTLTERMQIRYDGNVGIGTTNPVHTLDIDDGATTAEVRVRGGGTDYTNAGIVLQATNGTHDRGLGVFMHDEGGDVEWYAGTPYAAADQYIVARGGTASHSTTVAQRGSALFRIGSNGLWEFNTYNPQASIRTYVYEATVAGNTVKDLFYNTGAYDDLHFIIWVECHHSSRTYFCGTGNIGYYGLNFSGSGTGLSNGGLQIATVNTGRKMLQFNNSNSLNSSTFIAAMIFGNNGVTVSNGSISNTTI